MWTYVSSDGRMIDRRGNTLATGYSGAPEAINNVSMQTMRSIGPIPVGRYGMMSPVDTVKHGPYVIWLEPDPENEMFGRSEFGIHGDSVMRPGTASEGCIIMPPAARKAIWESGDHLLQVVSTLEDNSEEVMDAATGEV